MSANECNTVCSSLRPGGKVGKCIVSALNKYRDGERCIAALPKERRAMYKCKGEDSREVVADEDRQCTLDEWQLAWQNESGNQVALRCAAESKACWDWLFSNLTCIWLWRYDFLAEYFERHGTRQQLCSTRREPTPDNITRKILRNGDRWSRVGHFVRLFFILKKI